MQGHAIVVGFGLATTIRIFRISTDRKKWISVKNCCRLCHHPPAIVLSWLDEDCVELARAMMRYLGYNFNNLRNIPIAPLMKFSARSITDTYLWQPCESKLLPWGWYWANSTLNAWVIWNRCTYSSFHGVFVPMNSLVSIDPATPIMCLISRIYNTSQICLMVLWPLGWRLFFFLFHHSIQRCICLNHIKEYYNIVQFYLLFLCKLRLEVLLYCIFTLL